MGGRAILVMGGWFWNERVDTPLPTIQQSHLPEPAFTRV